MLVNIHKKAITIFRKKYWSYPESWNIILSISHDYQLIRVNICKTNIYGSNSGVGIPAVYVLHPATMLFSEYSQ